VITEGCWHFYFDKYGHFPVHQQIRRTDNIPAARSASLAQQQQEYFVGYLAHALSEHFEVLC